MLLFRKNTIGIQRFRQPRPWVERKWKKVGYLGRLPKMFQPNLTGKTLHDDPKHAGKIQSLFEMETVKKLGYWLSRIMHFFSNKEFRSLTAPQSG